MRVRLLPVLSGLLIFLGALSPQIARAADARFDLVGPKVDVRVTRGTETLPIASVPNLQPGDRLWLHPDLPPSQSVKYLLICAFLRGNTNPPPENWFFRVETWKKEVREEGVFVTVPDEAQEAVLFMAPETGGDFATLKSAVRGRPGVFVRASQDLNEAGFEQARIERYLAEIRRVPPADAANLQKHSDLLARTLALKPNADCFKRPVDVQFTCLTQTGSQTLLDDGHGQNIVSALSSGSNSDFIQAASYTGIAGAGVYSAYVGAIVDLVRIMSNLHTAQYQYIPAIAFPQGDALNLRLNMPPSFHNPKSVLVIGLPSVQAAVKPPLRQAGADQVVCLLKPSVVLPIEGAPLVFSTDFATGLVLHLNLPGGSPAQDIPLKPDAYEGGLVLQEGAGHHVPLRDSRPVLSDGTQAHAGAPPQPAARAAAGSPPVIVSGTIAGRWGFDGFTGPTLWLQQLPGGDWHVVQHDGAGELIAGKSSVLTLGSTGSACVHTITAGSSGDPMKLNFEVKPGEDHQEQLAVTVPESHAVSPGNLHLSIQQYGQPSPDSVAAQTFADPAHVTAVLLAAGDRSMMLEGAHLEGIEKVAVGDLAFTPTASETVPATGTADHPMHLRLALPANAPSPPTHSGDKLSGQVTLNDGRTLALPFTVLPARPALRLLSRNFEAVPGSAISLVSPEDLPLSAHLSFTVKSRGEFPRSGRLEVATEDGALRTVLTLAPSGGLVLQDPHTIVASLEPLRSFGPSAFGPLRLRAIFPPSAGEGSKTAPTTTPDSDGPTAEDPSRISDWLPLGTLVRLPTLVRVQCPADASAACTLSGSNLFLLQAVSADPSFSNPAPVPDGFTGSSLPVPHPAGSAGTIFLKLRDDPGPVNSAVLPTVAPPVQASNGRPHPLDH